jgi:arylsulfatase A-like enzyme
VLVLPPAALHAAAKPNILLIYADDIGYGDVGCYGATAVRTPNVDRLAKEGLRFTSGYCAASTCTPSRYAMMTGEYAFRKKGTGILPGNAAMIIPTERATLPSILKQAGYATGIVGKWHLGRGLPARAKSASAIPSSWPPPATAHPVCSSRTSGSSALIRAIPSRSAMASRFPANRPASASVIISRWIGAILEHSGNVAIRQGMWKFIPAPPAAGKPTAARRGPQVGHALSDLAKDPAEACHSVAMIGRRPAFRQGRGKSC